MSSRPSRPRRSGGRSTRGTKVSLKVKLPTAGSGVVLDRELDSDPDEPLLLEEQFILRLPEGSDVHKKVAAVAARHKLGDDSQQPFLKFLDSRRAVFGLGDAKTAKEAHPAKLVDLPCIIESHKTLDNARHMYKVADICQMLVVEPGKVEIARLAERHSGRFEVEEYVWPHGITPPLRHVRKRRFRKRANKRTIEAIEKAVERLLEDDQRAESSKWELVDRADDMSDSSDEERRRQQTGGTDRDGEDGDATPAAGGGEDIDEDMQAALAAIEDSDEEGGEDDSSGSDRGGLFGSDDDDEEEAALVNATVNSAVEMEDVVANGKRADMSDEDSSDGEDNPALAAARERVVVTSANVRDRQAIVETKTREMERLTVPQLRQRAEASLRQLKQSLETSKSEHQEAVAELDRIKRGE